MTVSKRLVALALLVASYTLFVWMPLTPANAQACRLMEDEVAEGASHGFSPILDYQGTEARAFVAVVNRIAPGVVDADHVRIFAKPGFPNVMMVFVKNGCFVLRFAVPDVLYKDIHNETLKSLANG